MAARLPATTEAIITGSDARWSARPGPDRPVASWENEGGALIGPKPRVPAGVGVKELRRLFVGPYVYDNLDLAVAEHLRQLSAAPHDELDPALQPA